jgi:hypothetical protein
MRVAPDRRHGDAERRAAGNAGDRGAHARLVAALVEEQPDLMPARGLFHAEVDDMAKQAAERRAKHMNDTQRARIQSEDSDRRRRRALVRLPKRSVLVR